jgi:hypothetical protein
MSFINFIFSTAYIQTHTLMKKINLTIVVILASLLLCSTQSCNKHTDTIPSCIKDRLAVWSQADPSCTVIYEYYFQQKIVYVCFYGCGPDFLSPVLDENCNQIGFLGGEIGNEFVNGVEFYENAVLINTIRSN